MASVEPVKLNKRDVKRLTDYKQNATWFLHNIGQIKKKYPDRYVAVYQGKVIDSDIDISKMIKRLKREYRDTASIAIEYVSSKKAELIL